MAFDVNAARQSGYSDEEIDSYLRQTNRSISEEGTSLQPGSTEAQRRPTMGANIIKNLPIAGEIAGGFAGPVGAGAGFSLGHAIKRIADELTNIGPVPEKAEDFSYLKEIGKNITDPRNIGRGTQFVGENIAGAGAAAATDLALGGFGSEAKLVGKLSETSPILQSLSKIPLPGGRTVGGIKGVIPAALEKVGGPLIKAKGVGAKAIAKTAGEAAGNIWKSIQGVFDEAGVTGKTIDVSPIIKQLEERVAELGKGFDPAKVVGTRIADQIEGFLTVIDDLKKLSSGDITSLADNVAFELSPQAVQTFKSILGEESFAKKTGLARVFSGLFESGEQKARKIAGKELRKLVINYLEKQGLKGAAKQYDAWAKLNKLAKLSSQGQQRLILENIFFPSIIGGPLSAVGAAVGGPSVAAFPLLYAAGTPYGNQLLRELVEKPIAGALDIGQRGAVSGLINSLQGKREGAGVQ